MADPERSGNNEPTKEQLTARLIYAQRFIDEAILPHIKDENDPTFLEGDRSETVRNLYEVFRQQNPGPGNDFDLIHSWIILFEEDLRNRQIAENSPEKLPEDAADKVVALSLLEDAVWGMGERENN